MRKPTLIEVSKGDSTEFIIRIPVGPLGVRIPLAVFASLGFVIPVLVLVYGIHQNKEVGFGFVLASMMGFGTGIYLFRFILWNTYGAEHIIVSDSKIQYFCNYRFFKDNSQTFDLKRVSVIAEESVLHFITEKESFSTSVQLPGEMAEMLCEKIKALTGKYL